METDLKEVLGKGGRGVIGTSSPSGDVNLAVYASPEIIDEGTVAFGMTEGKTKQNLLENPRASYLFMESGPGFKGVRIQLALKEIVDSGSLLEEKKKRLAAKLSEREAHALKYVAFFTVKSVRPLL